MSDDKDRKYDPTPRRREQFRKEGKFARARDAGAVAAIGCGLAIFMGMRGSIHESLARLFRATVGDTGALARGELSSVQSALGEAALTLGLPCLLGTALAATAVGFAQAGISPSSDLVAFKAERLDPIPRLGRLFSIKAGGVEVLLATVKVLVVGGVAYTAIRDELSVLLGLWAHDVGSGAGILGDVAARLTLKTLGAAAVVTAIDYAWSRYSVERDMKMTLQELRDEMRQEDGDPQLKARMRSRARAIAKRRMMSDVKQATVVLANPTHVSVALRYEAADPAPIVVAKGHDEVALAIRTKAREHGIPIVENRPLARLIDAEVAIGKPIGVEHFAAVAKVLAFVYNLKRRARR